MSGEHGVNIIRKNLTDSGRHAAPWMRAVLCAVIATLIASSGALAAPKKGGAKAPAKGAPSAKKLADAKAVQEKAAGAFEAFCNEWMGKLATRERDNKSQIKWQTNAGGTTGEYIGYSQDRTCQIKEQTDP